MKKACVIGWPIEHSRSPLIHNYWLKEHGIDAIYEKKAVEPENVAGFIAGLALSEFVGCNVTIPHKESAFQAVAETDKIARRLGAVNTVYLRTGKVCGTNTDGEGFIASLRQQHPAVSLQGTTATVIGAGGAAKAIIGALIDAGVTRIGIINRTRERILGLQEQFGSQIIEINETAAEQALATSDLLINTTSLGMEGGTELGSGYAPPQAQRACRRHHLRASRNGSSNKGERTRAIRSLAAWECCSTRPCGDLNSGLGLSRR